MTTGRINQIAISNETGYCPYRLVYPGEGCNINGVDTLYNIDRRYTGVQPV